MLDLNRVIIIKLKYIDDDLLFFQAGDVLFVNLRLARDAFALLESLVNHALN